MPVQVSVTRSGGFAGLVRTGVADVEESVAARWAEALEADTDFVPPVADGYVYEVSIGSRSAVVREPVPPEVRGWLDAVLHGGGPG